jgi:hypothetical protein
MAREVRRRTGWEAGLPRCGSLGPATASDWSGRALVQHGRPSSLQRRACRALPRRQRRPRQRRLAGAAPLLRRTWAARSARRSAAQAGGARSAAPAPPPPPPARPKRSAPRPPTQLARPAHAHNPHNPHNTHSTPPPCAQSGRSGRPHGGRRRHGVRPRCAQVSATRAGRRGAGRAPVPSPTALPCARPGRSASCGAAAWCRTRRARWP